MTDRIGTSSIKEEKVKKPMFVQSDLQDKVKVGEIQRQNNKNAFIFSRTLSGGSVKFPRSDSPNRWVICRVFGRLLTTYFLFLRLESLLPLNNTPLTVGILQLNAGISYRPARKEKTKKKLASIQDFPQWWIFIVRKSTQTSVSPNMDFISKSCVMPTRKQN